MIHIVFEEANIAALQKSFELDAGLQGNVLLVADDYAVGPLGNIYTNEAIEERRNWWRSILQDGPFNGIADDGHVNDSELVRAVKNQLDENVDEVLWIWAAQNKHDVCGYYWFMSQFATYQGRIFILYLNNLPFINDKGGLFYPTSLFQIQPREFVKAKKLARPITPSEFEVDTDEWMKLCQQNKGVRLLEGGKKLVSKSVDFYDDELLKLVVKDWQKVSRLFNQYYSKIKETTADAYLVWRINEIDS